jgi:hypothetical protein
MDPDRSDRMTTTDPRRDCDTSTEVAHLRGLIRGDA